MTFFKSPKGGFHNLEEFAKAMLEANRLICEEKEEFNKSPEKYLEEDNEDESKVEITALVECADGRNSPMLFLKKDSLFTRFDNTWLPVAGVMIFPEIDADLNDEKLEKLFAEKPELKELAYKRLEMMFGETMGRFLNWKKTVANLSHLNFEFQSHFDKAHFPEHGCGAHGSDFNKAQLETLKVCFVVEKWLKDTYAREFADGYFRVYRTVHDTHPGGNVYTGDSMDKEFVKADFMAQYKVAFEQGEKRFVPVCPKMKDGIFRPYQGNPCEICEDEHDEQIIRVSNTHFAHTEAGQSVLEISWADKAEILSMFLKVLLGIVDKNYRKQHPELPAIVHLDIPKGNAALESVYKDLMVLMDTDEVLKQRRADGILLVYSSVTDPVSYMTEARA